MRKLLTILGLALQVVLLASTGHAATKVWDGGGANDDWATQNNWNGNALPAASGDTIVFGTGFGSGTSISLGANRSIAALSITNATSFSLDNNTLTLSAGTITRTVTTGTTTINSAVTLGANGVWNIEGNLTVSGIVSDSGTFSITKNGAGTLILSGVNSYDGGTIVNNGMVVMSGNMTSYDGNTTVNGGIMRATTSANSLGDGSSGNPNTVFLAGGELQLANNTGLAYNRPTTVSANSTVTSDRLANGAGVTHTMGTLSLGAQTLTVNAGSFVNSGTAGTTFGATTLTGNATFNVVNSGSANAQLTLGAVGQTGGARSLTKTGSGTLVLNGAGTYTGGTTLSGGAITLGAANALGTTASGLNFAGGTLNANNQNTSLGALSLTANSTLNLVSGTATTLTFNGAASWTAGTLTINNWAGTQGPLGAGTDDRIFITGGASADFLSHTRFDISGTLYFATMNGTELLPGLTPVPEPTEWALIIFAVLGAFYKFVLPRLRRALA